MEDSRDLQRISKKKKKSDQGSDLHMNERKHLRLGKEAPERITKNNT